MKRQHRKLTQKKKTLRTSPAGIRTSGLSTTSLAMYHEAILVCMNQFYVLQLAQKQSLISIFFVSPHDVISEILKAFEDSIVPFLVKNTFLSSILISCSNKVRSQLSGQRPL